MSARVLVAGVLFRAPARKTSKDGRPYVFATIREGNGDAARWWKVFVFSETAIAEIMQLDEGDALAVAGTFEAKIYVPEGREARVDLSLTADGILSAKPKPRERKADKPSRSAPADTGATASSRNHGGDLDDDVPF